MNEQEELKALAAELRLLIQETIKTLSPPEPKK
jgi:hypothetical protein